MPTPPPINPIEINIPSPSVTLEPLKVSDFTTEQIDGTGVFDVFMRATKAHIAQEYNSGRIKGPEYASVYLSALNATADRALEFLMRRDEQWLKNQALLLEIEKVKAEIARINADIILTGAQRDKVLVEIELLEAELAREELNKDLIRAQIDKIRAEIVLISAQLDQTSSRIALDKANTNLITQQIANAKVEADVMRQNICKTQKEIDVMEQQIQKLLVEMALLSARTATENAQATVPPQEDSVLHVQNQLVKEQIQGFKDNHAAKLAKIRADMWSVYATNADSPPAATDAEFSKIGV